MTIKPGDMSGKPALLRVERLADDNAMREVERLGRDAVKGQETPDRRRFRNWHKGSYN
jgi:hypothetical protein